MRMGLFSHSPAPQEGHPVDRLSELLGQAVQFAYTCWDRVVLSGYIERLQRPENLIYFFQDVVGLDCVEPAVLEQRTTAYKAWVRRVVPVFSPDEREALRPGYRYSMAQMELATDVVFKRSAPLRALFQRACELGVLVGGANRTTHLFGRRINRHYQGKLQTVLDQREAGHPVLRWYYQTSFAKQYVRGDQHSDRILRTETCSNDTRHFGIGRRLENLPLLREKLAATNERCLALQAELLASTVDSGQLAALARPTLVGQRRIPGLKLHDDRVIRLLETLLHPAGFVGDWTTRELHTRIVARHRLAGDEYRLSQLRYDLSKLRAKGLVQRIGKSRRYCLTPIGLKLGVLLVKLRLRLLGPLTSLIQQPNTNASPRHLNSVDAAYRQVDTALDHLSAALGLQHTA